MKKNIYKHLISITQAVFSVFYLTQCFLFTKYESFYLIIYLQRLTFTCYDALRVTF